MGRGRRRLAGSSADHAKQAGTWSRLAVNTARKALATKNCASAIKWAAKAERYAGQADEASSWAHEPGDGTRVRNLSIAADRAVAHVLHKVVTRCLRKRR